jgi:hypothetical protein
VLGFSATQSQRLATLWVLTTALAGVLLKLPGTLIPVLLILLVVLVLPLFFLKRLTLTEHQTIKVPVLAWQGTLIILSIMLALILTNSGIVAFALDGDTQQLNVLSTVYCERTSCLPPEIKAWFLP